MIIKAGTYMRQRPDSTWEVSSVETQWKLIHDIDTEKIDPWRPNALIGNVSDMLWTTRKSYVTF